MSQDHKKEEEEFPKKVTARQPRQREQMKCKGTEAEACLGECRKCSLEPECGCRWVSKGRRSSRERRDEDIS